MQHTVPIRVVGVAGMLTLVLMLGACSGGQQGGVSSSASPSSVVSNPSPTTRPATSTPTTNDNTASTTHPTVFEQQIAQAVFQAINVDRNSAGLPALGWSISLISGAYAHSLLMSANDRLAHQLPGEPAIGTRISQDGVNWTWCGENIGETTNTSASGALEIHQMMMAERPPNDGHRQNILSANFTLVGIAVVVDSSHQLWLTEDFAN
jgi:uncharacterized protein YkwD